MRKYFTVAEVSEIMKISPRTLRQYDKIGLLKPVLVDTEARARFYSYGQLEALTIIMLCSKMGMSTRELRNTVAQQGMNTINFLMEEGERRALEKIESLRGTMLKIDSFSEEVARHERCRNAKGIYKRVLDPRCVAIKPCNENDSDEELYSKSMELYFEATEKNIPVAYHGGMMGISNGDTFGWFVYLDTLEEAEDEELILHLPKGSYDCRIVPNAENRGTYIAGTACVEGYEFTKGSVVVFSELYDYHNLMDNKTEIQILIQKDKEKKDKK